MEASGPVQDVGTWEQRRELIGDVRTEGGERGVRITEPQAFRNSEEACAAASERLVRSLSCSSSRSLEPWWL